MSYQITLQPSGLQYSAEPSATVLQSALDAGFMLPYGCRNGACGACKGQIAAGQVDHGSSPETTLPPAEREAGMALFCCAKPLSDLVLDVRDVRRTTDIPIKKMPCRVQSIERRASDVIVLTLKLPTNDAFHFLAGQYIDFLLEGGKRRSFSIANAPEKTDEMELHIRLVPGGKFTGHVFNELKERDILRFEGPLGSFYLRESKKPIVMIAGGTGFAPIKSLVEHMIATDAQRPVTLYWGARDRAGLYHYELAQSWESALPGLKFVPVISDNAPVDWSGRTGFVHRAALADFPDMSGVQVYVCGAPPMVDAAHAGFTQKCGLPESEFFADSFTFSSDS